MDLSNKTKYLKYVLAISGFIGAFVAWKVTGIDTVGIIGLVVATIETFVYFKVMK